MKGGDGKRNTQLVVMITVVNDNVGAVMMASTLDNLSPFRLIQK